MFNPGWQAMRRLSSPLLMLVPADLAVAFASLYAGVWARFGFSLEQGVQMTGPIAPRATSYAVCAPAPPRRWMTWRHNPI